MKYAVRYVRKDYTVETVGLFRSLEAAKRAVKAAAEKGYRCGVKVVK